jgi:hypothetical protein
MRVELRRHFLALLYLTGEYVKPVIIAGLFFGSSILGIGRPWLFFACFVAALGAVAVALGVPAPGQSLARRLLELLGTGADLRAAVIGDRLSSSSRNNNSGSLTPGCGLGAAAKIKFRHGSGFRRSSGSRKLNSGRSWCGGENVRICLLIAGSPALYYQFTSRSVAAPGDWMDRSPV